MKYKSEKEYAIAFKKGTGSDFAGVVEVISRNERNLAIKDEDGKFGLHPRNSAIILGSGAELNDDYIMGSIVDFGAEHEWTPYEALDIASLVFKDMNQDDVIGMLANILNY